MGITRFKQFGRFILPIRTSLISQVTKSGRFAPPKAVLRLHVTKRFTFLPPPRIRIDEGNREALEMILNRHLSACLSKS
jgi:hypothetical protein